MPVLLITGTLDNVVPPGAWDDDLFTTTSNDNDRFYYTGATAITKSWADAHGCDITVKASPVEVGYDIPDCRTIVHMIPACPGCSIAARRWAIATICRGPGSWLWIFLMLTNRPTGRAVAQ